METRRDVLRGLAVGLGVLACGRALGQPADEAAYVGIETSARTGHSEASFFSASGARTASVPLDFRAHGMAQGGRTLIVFPRRPGTMFAAVDLGTLEIRATVHAPEGRHFYGHGAVSSDGKTLLAPENDLESLQGHLALYDMSASPRRLGSVPLPGAGPHEIIREAQRDVFYVALGGLETHPDYGRLALNRDSFRSRILAYDLGRDRLSDMGSWAGTEGISLRHMAQDADGVIYVGGQVVDARRASGDVLWRLTGGGAEMLQTGRLLSGYVSSVATRGREALVTSKTSGRCVVLRDGKILEARALEGASAVASVAGKAIWSGFTSLSLGTRTELAKPGHEFDNHGFSVRL
ncbi:MAG: DUF1513 domain-containing protein [Pseudomonadota bacterium]